LLGRGSRLMETHLNIFLTKETREPTLTEV
jgi:hypothetical protein